jgi:hypothetical protein
MGCRDEKKDAPTAPDSGVALEMVDWIAFTATYFRRILKWSADVCASFELQPGRLGWRHTRR